MVRQSFKLFKIAFSYNKVCWKYLIITLILEGIAIFGLYHLNTQYGSLYQGIQEYNTNLIWKSIGIFSAIAGGLVIVGGFTTYFSNYLAFQIRQGLTSFYTIDLVKLKTIENIEQRIQEDLRNFGRFSVDFWLSILKAVIKLPLFLSVIVSLTSWHVGLIVLGAVVLGTYLTKIVTTKLVTLQVTQESNEANFRKAIAIRINYFAQWLRIRELFHTINKQIKKLTFLQAGLGQTFVLLPFILLIPLYIAKTITMGAFFQSVNALSKVIDSLTILIDQRQLIADIATTLKRMEQLDEYRTYE
jgi:ABC-type uncharacterized transport system fused permease/ATPase subunit